MVLVLTLRAVSGYSLSREPVYATAREYDKSLDVTSRLSFLR